MIIANFLRSLASGKGLLGKQAANVNSVNTAIENIGIISKILAKAGRIINMISSLLGRLKQ
jgi:hypothetical protein